MSNVQVVNLADNINAAVLKINQNFAGVESGEIGGGLDSSEVVGVITETVDSAYVNNLVDVGVDSSIVNNIVNNILDSDYFLTTINQEYLNQFTINTDVSYLDSEISANASAITTVISRIDGNSDSISILSGVIDSVEADLILRDSATNDRIDLNTSAISSLTSRITANESGLTAVVSSVDSLGLSLDQFITDGIEITPEQVTAAIGGALDELTLRLNADSDKLVLEAEKIVDLDTQLTALDSETGAQITAVSNAQSLLVSRTEYNALEGTVTATASDVTNLQNEISITNPDGTLSTAIADAKSELISYVDTQGNTVSTWGISLVAGTESNPKVAGIKFGNDGTTSDFAITTDTFKILNSDGTDSGTAPFSVSNGVVELSNAKVTGEIDVTTSDSEGSMNIKGNLITIEDGQGNVRIKLGKLSN